MPRIPHVALMLLLVGVGAASSSACRAKPAPEQPAQSEEYVSGCVSNDHTFRELLEACTRDYGTKFVLLDDVERDFAQLDFTRTSCFIAEGTKASDLKRLSASIEMVQQHVLSSRSRGGLDLMIDREPVPGSTNTYRIYRLPHGAQSPWDCVAKER